MDKLELYTSEVMMLKEMIESDLESTGWGEIDYSDVELMKYYSDRAVVYHKVLDLLRT
jgi:beta-xylosidase